MSNLVSWYEAFKDWLVPSGQAERALVHIHLGLAIFLIGAAFSSRGLRSIRVLLVLLSLELANEIADLWEGFPHLRAWRIVDTRNDIVNTMLWPVLLWLGATIRHRRATLPDAAEALPEPEGEPAPVSAGESENGDPDAGQA